MIRKECFCNCDTTLKDICNNDQTFGCILTICCGDYRQILFGIMKGNDAVLIDAC